MNQKFLVSFCYINPDQEEIFMNYSDPYQPILNLGNAPLTHALGIEAEILFLPLYFGKKRLQRKARPRPVFWRGNALISM